jgi:hypothetical protein
VVKFLSTDGKPTGEKAIDMRGTGRMEIEEKRFFVYVGGELMLYENGSEPLWKTKLADEPELLGIGLDDDDVMFSIFSGRGARGTIGAPRRVVSGGDAIAMKTQKGIVVLDAKTGQTRWTRAGLAVHNLSVGPDGAVYATVDIDKDVANVGEAATFRPAVVAHGGFNFPSEKITVLLRLDPKTGSTVWGVKYIGRHLIIQEKDVLVVDSIEKMHPMTGSQMFENHLAVRSLKPKNGKDNWLVLQKADIRQAELVDKTLFMVITDEPPAGRDDPKQNYKMQVISQK